jgi:transcriptional regulator with XRE-family HTH domain/tetratricopeptide (TPR) repeat protein
VSGNEPFGVVLRSLRQQARWTIEELAEASGVSVRAIGDMERGHSRTPQRRTVAALADGLGLTDAEREALLAAARAGRPTRAAAGTVAGAAVPPRSVGDFTGRNPELARLSEAAERARAGEAASVTVISGPPGCGKTTLALKAAGDLAQEFPDGCLVVDLHGIDGPVDPGEALLKLLKALGMSDRQLAQEDPAGLLRALLCERRCLVVLDNARDEAQVRPLLPAGGHSMVLVTSRRPLTGLEDVDRLALAELAQSEAVELLRRIIGEARADGEAEAVARVAELCGRLPLALRVAGNWLAVRSGWSVDHLVRRLTDEERRLGALAAGDVRVEAAFELSYRQLAAQAARMLRLLSLIPGPDFTAAYGATLTAVDLFEAEDVMEELVEAGLLQASFTGRYQLHDLLRLFARTRLTREETPGEREAAEDRLHTWLLETATVAGRWFKPGYEALPSSWQGLDPLESAEQARAWLESEGSAWFAALRTAAARGEHTRVVDTADAMSHFCGLSIYWGHWPEVFRLSSEAAAALDDPYLQAVHLNYYAWAMSNIECQYREAIELADEALECARRAQDASQQAWSLVQAAWPHKQLGELQERFDKTRAAVDLFDAAGDQHGWLHAMTTHSGALRDLGRAEEALALHERIIAFLDTSDCPVRGHVADFSRAYAISGLGRDYAALGRWREAADHFRSALLQIQQLGVPAGEGSMLLDLGQALIELDETDEARSCLRQVLTLGETADSDDLKAAQGLLDSLPAE